MGAEIIIICILAFVTIVGIFYLCHRCEHNSLK